MLLAFISYKDQFSSRTASLVDKIIELRMLRLHGARVADIVLTEAEEDHDSPVPGAVVSEAAPLVELRNVTFRYSDHEPDIFTDLNLTIPAGQCIAITGPSGGGKTTLVKLLLGLLQPSSGEICIDGIPIGHLGVGNFRERIGTVMQDDLLFSGSIIDNICFFDPAPDLEHAQACAQLAAVRQEIVSMPMGFNTLVGDLGTGLSGGQKQRILLARALYRKPRLMVLDEATSHLDIWNEQAVNAAIAHLALTRILVAHRPETIAIAQRVIVLQNGKIMQDVTQEGLPQAVSMQA